MSDLVEQLTQKEGIGVWNAWRANHSEMPLPSLKGADLRGLILTNANLHAIDLSGAVLRKADLSGANLTGANLKGANLSGANLSGASLSGADLSEADLSEAILSGTNLVGQNLSEAKLHRAFLRGADLTGADLRGVDLQGVSLVEATLTGANLRKANLHGADLTRASLRSADLVEADLTEASLREGVLAGANLRDANLRNAVLNGADLRGADLWSDHLEGTSFTEAVGLSSLRDRAQSLLNTSYSSLTFWEAVSARGFSRILPAIFSLAWLVSLLPQFVSSVFPAVGSLIPAALAAPSGSNTPKSDTFIPPLGLSQQLFNVVVLMFVVVMVCSIGVLLWAGFVAKKKNQKAAALVEHFGSFLLGAFFGTRV
jgi:uncharacterized protein YjbI with pentapeptide repeats